MDYLRWILLGAGVVFILVLYLTERAKRSQNITIDDLEPDDLPDLSATKTDDLIEPVEEIKISARERDDSSGADLSEDDFEDSQIPQENDSEEDEDSERTEESTEQDKTEFIALHVISRYEGGLKGEAINSTLLANRLRYGNMDIFHRMGIDAKPQFSVANMIEPGRFDPETIHELRTPGITFFMQLPAFGSNLDAFTEMLQCAYKVAEMLDADLCDQQRNLLTETRAERLRNLASSYDER